MEFTKTSINGCNVTVVFTGDCYYTISDCSGIVCQAKRNDTSSRHSMAKSFTLRVGNSHTRGGSMTDDRVITAMKRFINKCEYDERYMPEPIQYAVETDCHLENNLLKLEMI